MSRNKTDTRELILATARNLYRDPVATHPTMDEVAAAAGIGRATLYRHFQNRDELLLTVLEEEARTIAVRVEKRLRKIANPSEYIVEGMLQAMAEIEKSELVQSIFQSGNVGAVNRLLFNSDRLINIGTAIMAPVVERAQQGGNLSTTLAPEMLVEWMLRILISLITVPSKQLKSRAAVRKLLDATLVPVLEGK